MWDPLYLWKWLTLRNKGQGHENMNNNHHTDNCIQVGINTSPDQKDERC